MSDFKKSYWTGLFPITYWGLLSLGYRLQGCTEVSSIAFTPVGPFTPPYKVHMRLRVFSTPRAPEGHNLCAVLDLSEDLTSFVVLGLETGWEETAFTRLLESVGLHRVSKEE